MRKILATALIVVFLGCTESPTEMVLPEGATKIAADCRPTNPPYQPGDVSFICDTIEERDEQMGYVQEDGYSECYTSGTMFWCYKDELDPN